jgi:hypothetical protein
LHPATFDNVGSPMTFGQNVYKTRYPEIANQWRVNIASALCRPLIHFF